MLRYLLVMMCLGLFTLNGTFVYGKLMEVQFSGELYPTRSSNNVPTIEGSFFYDNEQIQTSVGSLSITNHLEVTDFTIKANGAVRYYGGGNLQLESPRFPGIEIPSLKDSGQSYKASISIGEIQYTEREAVLDIYQRVLGFDPVSEFIAATGLNPDDSITEQDLYRLADLDRLTIEQDFICDDGQGNLGPCYMNIDPITLLETISDLSQLEWSIASDPVVTFGLNLGSTDVSADISSRLMDFEESSLWVNEELYPNVQQGSPYIAQAGPGSGSSRSYQHYRILSVVVAEAVPEPSSLIQLLICFSLSLYKVRGY